MNHAPAAALQLILVLNCGSSSIKFAVFDAGALAHTRQALTHGKVHGMGGAQAQFQEAGQAACNVALDAQQPYRSALQIIRERIAAPPCQSLYENWLDEEVGENRIEVKGGYEVFAANRERFAWALWQGPAKPSADDGKSAKASSERIFNGTSTLADECAELGKDPDEVFEQRQREHDRYVAAGMPSPFVRNPASNKDGDREEDETRKKERA